MKLLLLEGKKLLYSRYALLLIAVLFLANGALCYYRCDGDAKIQEEYLEPDALERIIEDQINDPDGLAAYKKEVEEAYAIYQKAVTEGFMKGLTDLEIPEREFRYTKTGKSANEKARLDTVYELYEKCISYPDDVENFIKERELRLIENEPGTYNRAYAEKVIDFYREFQTKGTGIGFERIKGWDIYFDYDAVTLFLPISAVILVAAVMLNDKTVGFYQILSPTRKGRRRTVSAKIGLVLILSVLLSVLFSLSDFAIIGLRYGYSSPFNAIQALDEFRYAPYDFTMISYFFVHFGMRTLTLCAFSMLLCLVASLLNNYVYTFFTGAVFVGLNFFVYTKDFSTPTHFIKVNNMLDLLLVNDQFTRYRAYNVFGTPTENLPILAVCFVLIAVSCIVFTPLLQEKTGFTAKNPLARLLGYVCGHIKVRPRKREQRKHTLLICIYEFKKIFFSPVILLLALALVGGSIYCSYDTYKTSPSFDTAVYNDYIDRIVGESDKESEAYLRAEEIRIRGIVNRYQAMQESWQNDEIPFEDYVTYLEEYSQASMVMPVLQRVKDHGTYIKNHENETGQKVWYVHNLGWDRLFDRGFDLCLYLLALLLFWRIFECEFQKNSCGGSFNYIQSVTKYGRKKTFFYKILTACAIFTFFFAVCTIAELMVFAHNYGFPELEAPLASIEVFGGVSANISILSYLVLSYLCKYIGFLLLILVTASLSQFAKRPIPILAGATFLTLLPHLLRMLGIGLMRHFDFTLLLDPNALLRYSAEENSPAGKGLATFVIYQIVIAVIVMLLIATAYWQFTKKRFNRETKVNL